MLSTVSKRALTRERSNPRNIKKRLAHPCAFSARRLVHRQPGQFTILIGSRARRAARSWSDIDVVRIGHKEPIQANRDQKRLVSYIDYDSEKFCELYNRGSLFLYHVFHEGRLVAGSATAWKRLKENFKVTTDFSQEISRNRKFLKWLHKGEKFRGAIIPYLAHTCRALKNLAIYSLARKRQYVFDKRSALQGAFPGLSKESIDLLIDANDSFERSPRKHLSSSDVPVAQIDLVRRQIAAAVQHAAR